MAVRDPGTKHSHNYPRMTNPQLGAGSLPAVVSCSVHHAEGERRIQDGRLTTVRLPGGAVVTVQ